MSLITTISDGPGDIGLSGSAIKPITEGRKVSVTNDQTSSGNWGWLDELGNKATDLLNNAADIVSNNYLTDLMSGAGEYPDSTGTVQDRPQNVDNSQLQQGFVEKNKTLLLVVGGILAVGTVVYIARSK
jgi:hypothetical protein